MTAKSKTSTGTFNYEAPTEKEPRFKVWPGNQPLHHEFLSQADFDARFEIVPEQPTTTTT